MDIINPENGEIIVGKGQVLTEENAQKVAESSLESVLIRSVLTCESRRGVCAKCYGRNMATGQMVDVGEAVGTIASQSIGEPGTQLTLRTFHTGGTASLVASQSTVLAKFDGKIIFENVKIVSYEDENGMDMSVVISRSGVISIIDSDTGRVLTRYDAVYGAALKVTDGHNITKNDVIFDWDPYNSTIITEKAGTVRYRDLIPGLTYREENDEQTGHITKVVIESRDRSKMPSIEIVDDEGNVLHNYIIPIRAQISVDHDERVSVGSRLVKIPRDLGRMRDITGGLPRVTELFEARSPQNPAVVSDIDGTITFQQAKRGQRGIVVTSLDAETTKEYTVPSNKYVLVQEGDLVRAGDRLTDGSTNPHDILRIKGVGAVQEYLVNEIQEVYRMQGVKINDKHIEVIVRQMLQKVRINDSGDSTFLFNDQTDRLKFVDENDMLKNHVVITEKADSRFKVGQLVSKKRFREANVELKKKEKVESEARNAEPATAEPLLLGITQASLTTESWLSAASFQETTRVLAEASIASKIDGLKGLKENIIIGQLVPAGTGLRHYQDMIVTSEVGNIFGSEMISESPEEETEGDDGFRRLGRRRITA